MKQQNCGWLQVIFRLETENWEQQFWKLRVSFLGWVFAQKLLLPGGSPSCSVPKRKQAKKLRARKIENSGWQKAIFLSGTDLGEGHLKNTLYNTSWWLSPSSAGCAYMSRASKSAVTGALRLLGKLFRGNTVNRHQLKSISSQNRFNIHHCSQKKTTLSSVW